MTGRRIGNWKPSKMATKLALHAGRQKVVDHEARNKTKAGIAACAVISRRRRS